MTKVLIIGDPHFKINNVKDTEDMAKDIIRIARECNPDFIVNLGDTLDRHESIHVSPITRATFFMAALEEIAPLYVIIGNHDRKNNRDYCSNEHPFIALKGWKNTTVIDDVFLKEINGQIFTFAPYVEPGRFYELLSRLGDEKWKESTCIFAHQEFLGAAYGAVSSINGDKWESDYPYIVSGHIHERQYLDNIYYPGTPIQHSFGCKNDKGISLITFVSRSERKEERFKLNVRQKKTLHLNYGEVDNFKFKKKELKCDYKVIISGASGELKMIHKHPNVIKWKREYGYKIITKDIPIETEEEGFLLNRPTSKYSKELYRIVRKDPVMKKIYNEIFQ